MKGQAVRTDDLMLKDQRFLIAALLYTPMNLTFEYQYEEAGAYEVSGCQSAVKCQLSKISAMRLFERRHRDIVFRSLSVLKIVTTSKSFVRWPMSALSRN